MKKLIFITFGILLLFTQCRKENNWWIIPGHEYTIPILLVENSNGTLSDAITTHFTYADRVTFTKWHPMGGKGTGVVKVYYTNYTKADTVFYREYDRELGYYVDSWYLTGVNTSQTFCLEYHFTWKKVGIKNLSFEFSDIDPILNKTYDGAFWKSLSREYSIEKEYRNEKNLAADVIVMKGDGIQIILD